MGRARLGSRRRGEREESGRASDVVRRGTGQVRQPTGCGSVADETARMQCALTSTCGGRVLVTHSMERPRRWRLPIFVRCRSRQHGQVPMWGPSLATPCLATDHPASLPTDEPCQRTRACSSHARSAITRTTSPSLVVTRLSASLAAACHAAGGNRSVMRVTFTLGRGWSTPEGYIVLARLLG